MPVFIDRYEISDDEVHQEMKHHPAPTIEDARRDASRALIIRRLLLQAAADRELIKADQIGPLDDEAEEALIETLLEQVIKIPSADDTTCKRYFEQNVSRFKDKSDGETLPYHMVKAHIKTYLEDKGHQAAFNAYVDSLMDKVNIVGMT